MVDDGICAASDAGPERWNGTDHKPAEPVLNGILPGEAAKIGYGHWSTEENSCIHVAVRFGLHTFTSSTEQWLR